MACPVLPVAPVTRTGLFSDGTIEPSAEPLASQLAAWAQRQDPGVDPATALRANLIWGRLHGIVSLEISGNFASMGIDPGQLFETELASLTR